MIPSRRRPGAAARRALRGLLALALLSPAAALAGDPAAGRAKAGSTCMVCHGELGVSQAPDAPNLAGQPEVYLVAQLKAYRSGKRAHEVMSLMAKPLSDADIENLAAWYASVKVTVEAPKG